MGAEESNHRRQVKNPTQVRGGRVAFMGRYEVPDLFQNRSRLGVRCALAPSRVVYARRLVGLVVAVTWLKCRCFLRRVVGCRPEQYSRPS